MNIAKYIDHTLLKRDAIKEDVDKMIFEAEKYNFASICSFPIWIEYLKKNLNKDSGVKVCAVVGFPYGTQTIETKVFEGKDAINKGADELDYVITVSRVHERDNDYLMRELREIRQATKGTVIKLIIETGLLNNEEKIYISKMAVDAGWDFIKTSTGIQTTGATPEDVELMKEIAGAKVEVKAAGGVRTINDAELMIKAGATRIGSSNGVQIIEGLEATNEY